MTKIAGSTVMVTGASGGLGAALCEQFLSRGAASVYAAARDVTRVRVRGAAPVAPDITDPRSVGELAARCHDVGVLVNNAGTAHTDGLFSSTGPEAAMLDMSVNYFGTLAMTRGRRQPGVATALAATTRLTRAGRANGGRTSRAGTRPHEP